MKLDESLSRAENIRPEDMLTIIKNNLTKTETVYNRVVLDNGKVERRPRSETTCLEKNWFDVSRIIEYLNSDNNGPILIAGMRGIGKTLTCRAALMLFKEKNPSKTSSFIVYKRNQQFEQLEGNKEALFENKDIVIVDDLHYVYDDIRNGIKPESELIDILKKTIEYTQKGGKAIIIAEDAISAYPIENPEFVQMLPMLELDYWSYHEPRIYINMPDTKNLIEIYNINIKDVATQNFINKSHTNPRGIVNLLITCGNEINYNKLVRIARKRFEDPELCYDFIKQTFEWRTMKKIWTHGTQLRHHKEIIKQRTLIFMNRLITERYQGLNAVELERIIKRLWKKMGSLPPKYGVHTKLRNMFRDAQKDIGRHGQIYLHDPLVHAFHKELQSHLGYEKELNQMFHPQPTQ